jgi:hypothetical protein
MPVRSLRAATVSSKSIESAKLNLSHKEEIKENRLISVIPKHGADLLTPPTFCLNTAGKTECHSASSRLPFGKPFE